mgnify:CR=1 FL=1
MKPNHDNMLEIRSEEGVVRVLLEVYQGTNGWGCLNAYNVYPTQMEPSGKANMRLAKEREFWEKTPPTNIRGRPIQQDMRKWEFSLKGPVIED